MTTATATRTPEPPTPPPNPRTVRRATPRPAGQLLATLADGVQSLTTSDGWRRYLRAMATLRAYSTGNSRMSQPRECPSGHLR